ncbi:MAG: nuclear transport factor 2 family protein [Actinomycetota bacterium]
MTDEHADRHAIEGLLDLYATIIDAREWERLPEVFLADAVLDYSASGAEPGPLHTVAAWIEKGLGLFAASQHLITNKSVELAGDRASSRALFFNPLVRPDGTVMFVGGAYNDRWLRTPLGWRIVERVQETTWTFGLPELRSQG